MQQLKAEVVLQIPEDHVIIKKTELEELKQKADPEWVSGLDWLVEQTSIKSYQQLKEKILFPFKDELVDFVDYPENAGGRWRFNSYHMKHWLRTNFAKIDK